MSKNEKWTDKKIQKLFEDKFLSKIHSPEFNFGCMLLYTDIEAKNPPLKTITNQLCPNNVMMLSNALYDLSLKYASPFTASDLREVLDIFVSEVLINHKGGEA